jgi:hypothetical protein
MGRTTPILLAVGGNYIKMHEMGVENVILFAFAWDIGGPNTRHQNAVSVVVFNKRHFRTVTAWLMWGAVIFVLSHIYHRILPYKSGMMTSRGNTAACVSFAERLAEMRVNNFKTDAPSAKFDELMEGGSISCKSLGHTTETVTFARIFCSAFVDHFGLNSNGCHSACATSVLLEFNSMQTPING